MTRLEEVKQSLDRILQLSGRAQALTPSSRLLGELPELDSIAVLTLIMGLEEDFGISVDDDEIDADVFATLGTLTDFIERKLGQPAGG